jgi:hypothetical protein
MVAQLTFRAPGPCMLHLICRPQTGPSSAIGAMNLARGRASQATIHRTKHADKASRSPLHDAAWGQMLVFDDA